MSDYSDMSRSSLIIEINRLIRDARNDAIAHKAVIERQEELRESLRQLKTENESLSADAERYRFARDEMGYSELSDLARKASGYWDDYIDAISSPENPS